MNREILREFGYLMFADMVKRLESAGEVISFDKLYSTFGYTNLIDRCALNNIMIEGDDGIC